MQTQLVDKESDRVVEGIKLNCMENAKKGKDCANGYMPYIKNVGCDDTQANAEKRKDFRRRVYRKVTEKLRKLGLKNVKHYEESGKWEAKFF